MDATISVVRAHGPFAPFVAIVRSDEPALAGHKRRKGSHPRSELCVASIDAAVTEGRERPRLGFEPRCFRLRSRLSTKVSLPWSGSLPSERSP